ncbi:hypothetical protein [Cryobacterium melibiosiphilum]|nr:hypothetical protein [Cryobacterium melibiosiphilum]
MEQIQHDPSLRRARIAAEVRSELAIQKKTRAALSLAVTMSTYTLRRRLDGIQPFTMDELDSTTRFLGISLADFVARTEAVAS